MNGFKVGDKVKIIKAQYGEKDGTISDVGSIGYVTEVLDHGCMIARYPDYDPDAHDENSLFFLKGGFKHATS